ncbi:MULTISPECIES: multidrug effflux MFS transporter [Phycicoccus]|uniref:multidrug effflux MFS transporter n=1 Tax=Phycicoccus TaxID=367298 RepID=UPI001DB3DA65|nr:MULTISPECIES: multidrug effflux MFS transporter [Phycicoccus]MCB1239701.1 multidrug effflux MFS transporter [Tetrasphaera sp.]HPF76494.1 multidrug effflux MFS transporter [Phycicoccus elongatus]HRV57551.1 multidrug effflux MFS transporter [Phycicoccus sp.]
MPRSSPQRAGLLLTLVLAGMSMLGPFSIDTPFPAFAQMRGDFGVGAEQMQLVVSAYMLAFAVMTPFHGPLSDAIGRKPVIIGALTAYAMASVGCALSPNLSVLLFFRVLQGLSAGGSTIIGRTIIRDLFDGPEAQRMMSRVMMIFGLAPAVAPIIGGLLLRVGPWPAIFWFIGGFALLLGAAVVAVIPETHPAERRRPLRLGPMLSDLWQVARSGEFERMSWAITFVFAGQFIYIGAAAIFVVDLLGKGEGDFWMFFVPMISGVIVGSWISGRAAGRVSARRLITVGFSFSAAAAVLGVLLAVAFGPVLPWAVVGPSLIALGSGTAFPTIQVALLDLFPSVRGAAASVAGVMPLATNAVIASAVAPIVTGSVTALALTSLALIVLGCLLWVWHLAATADPSRATSQ